MVKIVPLANNSITLWHLLIEGTPDKYKEQGGGGLGGAVAHGVVRKE